MNNKWLWFSVEIGPDGKVTGIYSVCVLIMSHHQHYFIIMTALHDVWYKSVLTGSVQIVKNGKDECTHKWFAVWWIILHFLKYEFSEIQRFFKFTC